MARGASVLVDGGAEAGAGIWDDGSLDEEATKLGLRERKFADSLSGVGVVRLMGQLD